LSIPEEISIEREARTVTIVWKDGHTSVYPFTMLRRECPCADCAHKRERPREETAPAGAAGGLNVVGSVQELDRENEVRDLTPVGNYALNIAFADGHSYGIYTYASLRRNCPCPQCRD